MTCSYCYNFLRGCTVKHKRYECPYRRSLYCHICCMYGHHINDCPDRKAVAIRNGLPLDGVENRILRITDCEKSIQTYLLMNDVTPSSLQHKNKELLLDLANAMQPPRMLIFTAPKTKN